MTTIWRSPPARPLLEPGEAHVWRIALTADEETLAEYGRLLADDEQARAERFYFARDRRRYTVARGTLRRLLGRYLAVDPQSLTFCYGAQGKPALTGGADTIEFNLSHAADLAAFAFVRTGRVGVDIEHHRAIDDLRRLAESVFSPLELAALDAIPPHQLPAAFYAGWTRKEAFIKAIGDGLSFPLKEFDVALTPGEPARLLRIHADSAAARRWSMVAFDPGEHFSGALVTEAPITRVSFWHIAP